jgi:hypothetical protein
MNRAAYSAAAAESTTVTIIVEMYDTGALGISPGLHSPRNMKPPARDLDFDFDRYEASE